MFAYRHCYCFYTVKWFQLLLLNNNSIHSFVHSQMVSRLLRNTNNSILLTDKRFQVFYINSFIYTQLNGSKHCCVSLTIQLNISHFFTHCSMARVLFLTIKFSIIHLFALSLKVKQFFWLVDRSLLLTTTLGQSEPGSNKEGVFHIPPEHTMIV